MRDPTHVTQEAIYFGAVSLLAGSVLMVLPVPWKYHAAWPFVGTFIVGFSAHWIFEAIGGNEWFCDQY